MAGGGAASVAGASVGGGSTRGRGRPRKSAGGGKGRKGGDEDGRSVRSGKSGKGRGVGGEARASGSVGGGGNGGAGEEGAEGEEEEELDEGGMAVMAGAEGGGEAERAAEKKKMAFVFPPLPSPSPYVLHGACGWITKHGGLTRISRVRNSVLIDAFDRDQQDRYDMYRRVKLKKETVRKVRLSISLPFHSLLHTPHHLTHPNPHLPILHKPKPTN